MLQPGGTHQHFSLANKQQCADFLGVLPARSQGGMEKGETGETNNKKNLEKLNSGASDILKGEICF